MENYQKQKLRGGEKTIRFEFLLATSNSMIMDMIFI